MFIQFLSRSPKHFSNIILCNTWGLRNKVWTASHHLCKQFWIFQMYPFPFKLVKKLIWTISPYPHPHHPKSLPFHLQVIFASKKNFCLDSHVAAIFLICFAVPDEYLYLHLCYRAAEHCLKLNHEATAFLPPIQAHIWDPLLTLPSSASPFFV